VNPDTRNQIIRFVRLFMLSLAAQAAALDLTHLGRSAIIAAVVGALEVAYRQVFPVVPVKPNSLG
jgi:hypothetical protein